ncbi:hypothetical protein [Solibacillus sp. NPDC093137]|uniref:hypothetical protein n=1 Tax=Solibacillus sp. NPDC093137 TaxID=3390678 RepID=UPI003CFBF7D2
MKLTTDYIEELIVEHFCKEFHLVRIFVKEMDPILVEEFLEKYPNVTLEINVLDTLIEGLFQPIHLENLRLVEEFESRLIINYVLNTKKELKRLLILKTDKQTQLENDIEKLFIGPLEFTRSYFSNETGYLVELDGNINNIRDLLDFEVFSCKDDQVPITINIYNFEKILLNLGEIKQRYAIVANNNVYIESVRLSLLDRKGEVPGKSGLNWGQRPNRDGNQMYLSVPKSIHSSKEEFFPVQTQGFLVCTADQRNLVCVMAQDNRKAIQTKGNTSILGKYFRERLGVKSNAFVVKEDLIRYGKVFIDLYKIKEGLYYLDF